MATDEGQAAVAEGLPEEVADAWAAVLIDIYEKRKAGAATAMPYNPAGPPLTSGFGEPQNS